MLNSIERLSVRNYVAAHPSARVVEIMNIKDGVKDVIRLSVDKRMMYINPESLWTGLSIAFYSGMLVTMMSSAIAWNNTTLESEALT